MFFIAIECYFHVFCVHFVSLYKLYALLMEAGSNFSNYKPIIKSPKFTKYDSKKLSQAHSGNKPYQKNSDRNHEKGTNRESSLVDAQTTQYYQRVLTMLSKDFEDQEERGSFALQNDISSFERDFVEFLTKLKFYNVSFTFNL